MDTNNQTNEKNPTGAEVGTPPIVSKQEGETSQIESEQMELSEETQRTNGDLQPADSKDQGQIFQRKFQKMNGSQRKRYSRLRNNGFTHEEAFKLSEKPLGENILNEEGKRPMLDSSLEVSEEIKKIKSEVQKEPKVEEEMRTSQRGYNTTFKKGDESVKLGIIHENYPEELTDDQMEAVQDVILNTMAEEEDESKHPCFHSIHKRQGYLVLVCQDEATVEWLKSKQEVLKPWDGTNLKLVPEAEIPHTRIITAYFPNSILDSNEKILKLVQVQNKGLNATEWKVLGRVEDNKNVFLTMAIDSITADKLVNLNLKINFKFGKIQLKLKNRFFKEGGDSFNDEKHEVNKGEQNSAQYSNPGTSVASQSPATHTRAYKKANRRRGFGVGGFAAPYVNRRNWMYY